MSTITTQQIKTIFKNLPPSIKKDDDARKQLISQFSKEGKTSTKDLSYEEANCLIAHISDDFKFFGYFDMHSSRHRYLMSLCYDVLDKDGNQSFATYDEEKQRMIPDINALGRWIATRSKFKKPIKELSPYQLGVVINQFEKVVKTGYEKVL